MFLFSFCRDFLTSLSRSLDKQKHYRLWKKNWPWPTPVGIPNSKFHVRRAAIMRTIVYVLFQSTLWFFYCTMYVACSLCYINYYESYVSNFFALHVVLWVSIHGFRPVDYGETDNLYHISYNYSTYTYSHIIKPVTFI